MAITPIGFPALALDPSVLALSRANVTRATLTRCAAAAGAAALMLAGFNATASAVTDDGTTTANVGVSSAITVSALTAAFTLTGIPGATVADVAGVTMNVETNNTAGYTVTVQPADDELLPTDTTANTDAIPIGALSVKESTDATYVALDDTTATTVHDQDTRSASGGDTISNDYQVVVPFVNSDTYSVTLNYVATTS